MKEISNMMNFGQALDRLRRGGKLSREGWNGKHTWIALQEQSGKCSASIHTHTVSGDLGPWLPSQPDILACDWVCRLETM